MKRLVEHVASLHAYSRGRIEELRALQHEKDIAPGVLCPPSVLVRAIDAALSDTQFLSQVVHLSDDERSVLADCRSLIEGRPRWVDESEVVCLNRDFSVSNTAFRDTPQGGQLVSFDWGAAHIGPIEEDVEVLLGRDFRTDRATQEMIVRHYLSAYHELVGRSSDYDVLMARIRWARLMVTLRYTFEHMNSLHWMRWQSRSLHFIHFFIGLAKSNAVEIRTRG